MLNRVKSDTIQTIEIGGGNHIRYSKTGSGKPLVLLHTIRTQLEYFRDLIPLLENNFTVYALDLPGHGYSSIDTKAQFDEPYFRTGIISLIETLDLSDVTLAGESIGGVLALTVASALPDRIKAVVALNPYDYDRHYADGVRRGNLFANVILGSFQIPLIGAINAALENRWFLGWILKGGLKNNAKLPRDLLKEFDRTGRRRGYRTVERKTFAGWQSWGKARALYSNVKAPVTLVYGDNDWSRDNERQANIDDIPNARPHTLKQTGHFSTLERPEKIAKLILETQTP